MNYLMCSVGRRGELLKDFRKSLSKESKIVAVDNSKYAPALYFADKQYIVPRIDDPKYIDVLIDICKKEKINCITTFIDPEISLLSKKRTEFENIGVEVLAPYEETAEICFDKYKMFKHLTNHGIKTPLTWNNIEKFKKAYSNNEVSFPVFVKPRTGSGSVGARKIDDMKILEAALREDNSLIIQEFIEGIDVDADIYIDTISHKVVSIFTKKKLEMRIGGAIKTISFKDDKLNDFIISFVDTLEFNGPIDADIFYKDGEYYLLEINPRFGGAYLNAYGAGVDFIKLIENNLKKKENKPKFSNYEDNIAMLMYDSVVINKMKN